MLRYSILIIVACFYINDAFGQSSFLKGFVVNLKGDTTYLQIKDRSIGKKPFIKVRQNNNTSELPLNQLQYFQIIGYELYKVDSAKAYNVLLQGDISLYAYDGSFWLEKDNNKVLLKIVTRSMTVGGFEKDVEVPIWRNEMARMMGKCTDIQADSKLHKRDLLEILETYHKCSGIPYQLIQNKKMTFVAQVQAGPEFTQSIVNIQKQEQSINAISMLALPDGPNFFMAPTYYSNDLFYNTNISVSIDRKHQFAIETGLNFGKVDFSSTEVGIINNQLYHSTFSYKSTTIPFILRYENQIGKLIFSGGGGMIYSSILDKEANIFIDSETAFGRVISTPENPAILDSSLIGFLIKIGTKYYFNNFFTGFNAKYYSQVGFNEIDTIDATYIRLSLELFLGYKFNFTK